MGYSKSFIQCVESIDLSYEELAKCADGPLGTELQLKMENASAIIKETGHVPTITFNHKYDPTSFYGALSDFYAVVMKKLDEIN